MTALTPKRRCNAKGMRGSTNFPKLRRPPLKLFLSQFTSVIVWVLIGAAVLSGLLDDWLDAAAIMAIVFLNGVLGFIQEFRAERSLAALRRMSVAMAHVIRQGASSRFQLASWSPVISLFLKPATDLCRRPADLYRGFSDTGSLADR